MQPDRREFLKHLGWLTAVGTGTHQALASEHAEEGHYAGPKDPNGVLVDLTVCIGCRLCEYACKKANGIDPGPVESYDDQSVFKDKRRPAPNAFTVVNAWTSESSRFRSQTLPSESPLPNSVYAKVNCLHCNYPACVSACIVGALRKQESGAVTYDAWKCIGCRYCMVACPFQIPAYSYDDALTPQVRKCELCKTRTAQGKLPACVEACPRQSMTFGKRRELLELAHQTINAHPDRYVPYVYGEQEVGGTSWLYLSAAPFEQLGFLKLAHNAPPALTEKIQHGVFSPRLGMPPFLLYGALGAVMYLANPKRRKQREQIIDVEPDDPDEPLRPGHPPQDTGNGGGEFLLDGHGSAAAVAEAPALIRHRALPHRAAHAHHDEAPMPVNRTLRTPGVMVLLALTLTGLAFGLYRFIFGIGAATNLDQQHPWGLWIAIDVASGVALAAGGFTSAFLTHILHREKYHAVARPALLTAMLGYTFVCLGLQADLGRYYNVWHPMIMWQGNSVLFEVGMCVMCYLSVLYLEFAPVACERVIQEEKRFPRLARLARFVSGQLDRIMFLLVIAGCALSCLHQSSLGNLMVIAPSKLHPLWWTPLSPALFLMSAIAVGFPMVIWESLFASWSLNLKPEMNVLGPLARFIPFTLGAYLIVKVADVIHRGAYVYLGDGSLQSICWLIEMSCGVLLPLLMLALPAVRRRPGWLFLAATLVVLGVIFNRVNVFLIGYHPPYATKPYFPSFGEFAVTIGLIACLMLIYRVIVTFLPVISQHKAAGVAHA